MSEDATIKDEMEDAISSVISKYDEDNSKSVQSMYDNIRHRIDIDESIRLLTKIDAVLSADKSENEVKQEKSSRLGHLKYWNAWKESHTNGLMTFSKVSSYTGFIIALISLVFIAAGVYGGLLANPELLGYAKYVLDGSMILGELSFIASMFNILIVDYRLAVDSRIRKYSDDKDALQLDEDARSIMKYPRMGFFAGLIFMVICLLMVRFMNVTSSYCTLDLMSMRCLTNGLLYGIALVITMLVGPFLSESKFYARKAIKKGLARKKAEGSSIRKTRSSLERILGRGITLCLFAAIILVAMSFMIRPSDHGLWVEDMLRNAYTSLNTMAI